MSRFPPEFLAALTRKNVHLGLFYEGDFASGTLRLWSGLGDIETFYQWVPAATLRNLLRFTQQFDNSAWFKTRSGTGVVPVVTGNAGFAPDGTMTASRIQLNLGAGTSINDWVIVGQQPQPDPAQTSTRSVWMRSFDGTSEYDVLLEASAVASRVRVTGQWRRFQFTSSVVGARDIALRGTLGTSVTADILAWGYQSELGATLSAYQRVDAAGQAFDAVGRVFSGAGSLLGVGDIDESRDIVATGTTVGLSAVPPELVAAAISEARQGAPGRIYLGVFERTPDGLFLIGEPVTIFAGLLNVPRLQGLTQARISIDYANRLVDLQRPRELRYNDQTQKSLYPGDRAFEYVAAIQTSTGWVRS